jgi:hypothetical protein
MDSSAQTSHRLRPAPEYDPRRRAPSCLLSRGFCPLSATQPSRSTTPGPISCPGHVAPSRLPCASAPYSLDGLPGIAFNQVRSRDPRPSELDLTAVAARLSAPAVPLAIGHAGPLSTQSCAVIGASSELEAGLASGLVPLPVGIRSSGVPSHHGSWLSWVSPPWGSPLPCSDLYGSRAIRNRLPPEPRSPLVER